MKRVIGIILVFILVIGGALVLLFMRSQPEVPVATPPAFPTSPTQGTGASGSLELPTREGTSIAVRRFIDDGTTIADQQNPGTYVVTGSLDYCLEDGSCPTTGEDDFTIMYFERDQAFVVGLGAEPLGDVRRRAEAALARAVGLEPAQLCALRVTVVVPYDVSPAFGSYEDLGLPSCAGSVPLP